MELATDTCTINSMSKQEEILCGVNDLLNDAFRRHKLGEEVDTSKEARKILGYEASQGCVLKVNDNEYEALID